MTILDYLEKIDNTLAHWEDYFHGQEGTDVTEARANLDKVRKQLIIPVVSKQSEQLKFLIEKFQTPKGNYIIELLMDKLEKEKL